MRLRCGARGCDATDCAKVPTQALATFGDEIGIAFSGAEDVALVEYAHLTGRPYRVFRCLLRRRGGACASSGCAGKARTSFRD